MQPRNPFMGQPPSNMQFPMQEYIQGAANAANTVAQGQAKMAEGISKGIMALGQGIGDYMSNKKDFSANMAMLESPTYRNILGIDEAAAGDLKKKFSEMQDNAGYSAANKQFSQLIDPLMKYAMMGKQLENQMQMAQFHRGTQMGLASMRQQDGGGVIPAQETPTVLSGVSGIDAIMGGGSSPSPAPAPAPSFKPTRTGVADFSPDIERMMRQNR